MEKIKRLFEEWIIPFALEILAVVLLIKLVFFFSYVPSGSMIPTIEKGSWIFATRVHNIEKTAERGQILVFESDELGITLIKRLIGLPGETVEINDKGEVYIDGVLLDEPYVKNKSTISGTFHVPEGCYLFLGDNRSGSQDARMWENPYIPGEKITGQARFTFWPLSNFGFLT